jgi:hypothetical protein
VALHVKAAIDAPTWFLNDRDDVRSSFYLEEVATEFDVQGLELDWTCVCWDADFHYGNGAWGSYRFHGTTWQKVLQAERRSYLKNAYRVMLTRARQGMIVFVPEGDVADPTRPPLFYDETYSFLADCRASADNIAQIIDTRSNWIGNAVRRPGDFGDLDELCLCGNDNRHDRQAMAAMVKVLEIKRVVMSLLDGRTIKRGGAHFELDYGDDATHDQNDIGTLTHAWNAELEENVPTLTSASDVCKRRI